MHPLWRLSELRRSLGTFGSATRPLHRIVSEQWVEQATSPNSSDNERAYGYQVWLNEGDKALRWPDLPADAYAFTGNRGQRVMIIPSQQTLIVRMGWSSVGYSDNVRFPQLLAL